MRQILLLFCISQIGRGCLNPCQPAVRSNSASFFRALNNTFISKCKDGAEACIVSLAMSVSGNLPFCHNAGNDT